MRNEVTKNDNASDSYSLLDLCILHCLLRALCVSVVESLLTPAVCVTHGDHRRQDVVPRARLLSISFGNMQPSQQMCLKRLVGSPRSSRSQ